MAEEEEEELTEAEEEYENLLARRALYKQYKCDALAWADMEDGTMRLILYKDITQRVYYAKMDIEIVRRLQKWADEFIQRQNGGLIGYQ